MSMNIPLTATDRPPGPAAPRTGLDQFNRWWLVAGLLFAVLVAFAPAVGGGFIWDDDGYVENNKALRSLDGLRRIWLEPGATQDYYPLTFTTFWIEWSLWRLRPLGYHIDN